MDQHDKNRKLYGQSKSIEAAEYSQKKNINSNHAGFASGKTENGPKFFRRRRVFINNN